MLLKQFNKSTKDENKFRTYLIREKLLLKLVESLEPPAFMSITTNFMILIKTIKLKNKC